MTALILIANRENIMMVGDTAVTISENKSVKGVHKIFELSNSPSMGIMAFGNSKIGSMPISTIIESFKRESDFSSLGTVENVKKEFLKFLADNTDNKSLEWYIKFHEERFRENFKFKLDNLGDFDFESFMKNQTGIESFEFLKEFNLDFSDLIEDFVDGEELIYYNNVLIKLFSRNLLQYSTGFVIAGYNRNSQLPSFTQFHVFVNDGGKMVIDTVLSENDFDNVAFIPFAMNQEINNYIGGISDDLVDFIENTVRNLLNTVSQELYLYFENKPHYMVDELENIKKDMGEFKNTHEYFVKKLINEIKKIKKYNENHVLNVIDDFPVDELIAYAEFFINLTSAKYRFSYEQEYVSDEADIAILKPDEFRWARYVCK